LFGGKLAEGFTEVCFAILRAKDVTDLTGGVGRDAGVSICDSRIETLAEGEDLLDQRQMEPHAFTLGREHTVFSQSILQEFEEFSTKETFSGT
jgi:hypothetical protein